MATCSKYKFNTCSPKLKKQSSYAYLMKRNISRTLHQISHIWFFFHLTSCFFTMIWNWDIMCCLLPINKNIWITTSCSIKVCMELINGTSHARCFQIVDNINQSLWLLTCSPLLYCIPFNVLVLKGGLELTCFSPISK